MNRNACNTPEPAELNLTRQAGQVHHDRGDVIPVVALGAPPGDGRQRDQVGARRLRRLAVLAVLLDLLDDVVVGQVLPNAV